jgi:hypothetical protein
MVDGAMVAPSLASSPWMRRYPQSGSSSARRTARQAMLWSAGGDRACAACSYGAFWRPSCGQLARTGPVRAENPVHGSDQEGCSPCRPPVMIIDHVPAVHVPPVHAASSVAAAIRREETWKTAEILILRHQLAVLQRRQPRRPNLNWADRALLATLLSVIPKARRQGLRLLRTRSCAGTATSSADAGPPGPGAATPAARPPAGTSRRWSCG